MNSNDEEKGPMDTILLFQYSRPQNVVMYWKVIVPIAKMMFIS